MIVPIAIAVSQAAGVRPIEPVLGATLGASMGFMMPVSTAPNAIVYSSGHVPIGQMMRHGFFLDAVAFIIIVCTVTLLGPILSDHCGGLVGGGFFDPRRIALTLAARRGRTVGSIDLRQSGPKLNGGAIERLGDGRIVFRGQRRARFCGNVSTLATVARGPRSGRDARFFSCACACDSSVATSAIARSDWRVSARPSTAILAAFWARSRLSIAWLSACR